MGDIMTEPLARQEIVALLERFGSADDQAVLAAARAVHSKIDAAGLSWDELLVADRDDESEAVEDAAVEESTEQDSALEGDPTAETLRLIDALLAKPGTSADFREELEGYKTDIAEGTFDDNDHRYIRAVYKRLNG